MVSSAAGTRCPECASYGNAQAHPVPLSVSGASLATAAGVLTGLAGAYLIAVAGMAYPLLAFIIAPIYGRLVADSILAFTESKASRAFEAVGAGSILLGVGLAFNSPLGSLRLGHAAMPEMTQAMIGLSIGIAVAICYSRLHRAPR